MDSSTDPIPWTNFMHGGIKRNNQKYTSGNKHDLIDHNSNWFDLMAWYDNLENFKLG